MASRPLVAPSRQRFRGAAFAYRAAIDTLEHDETAAIATSRRGFQEDVLPLYEEYADLMLGAARAASRQRMQPERCAKCSSTLEQLRIAEVRNYFENQCARARRLRSVARRKATTRS